MTSQSDPISTVTANVRNTRTINRVRTGFKNTYTYRIIIALPLLVFALLCDYTMGTILQSTFPFLEDASSSLELQLDNNVVVEVRDSFYGIPWLDRLVRVYVCASLPSIVGLDKAHRLQLVSFLFDLGPMVVVWIVEGRRRWRNCGSTGWRMERVAAWPFLFMMISQIKGIGIIAPVYYFIEYISCPLQMEVPSTTEDRRLDIHEAKTLLPAVLIGYYLPTMLQNLPLLPLSVRQTFCGYWQLYPVWLTILHHGLCCWSSVSAKSADRRADRRDSDSESDLLYIRRAYWLTGSISAVVFFYVRFFSKVPTWDIFLRGMFSSPSAVAGTVISVTDGMDPAMKYDALFTFMSGLFWITLNFGDLEAEGVVRFGTVRVVGAMLVLLFVFGPGAATAFCWGWREEMLHAANRKFKV